MGEQVTKALLAKSKKHKRKTAGLNGLDEKGVLPTDKFSLSDIEFKYTAGQEAVKLSGDMQLSTLEFIKLSSPWVGINGDYKFKDVLFMLAELMKYEVKCYVVDHKYAPPRDPELDFPDGPQTGDEEINPSSNFIIRPAGKSYEEEEQPF